MRGQIVFKIGYTSRRIYQRVVEITVDIYKKLGYFPAVEVIRTDKTRFYIEMEKEILDRTKEWQYYSEELIEGITEMRTGCPERILVDIYSELINKTEWPGNNARPLPPPPESINDITPINF